MGRLRQQQRSRCRVKVGRMHFRRARARARIANHEPVALSAAAQPHPKKGPQSQGRAETQPLRGRRRQANPQPHDATGSPQFGPRLRGSADGWRGGINPGCPVSRIRVASAERNPRPPLCRGSCAARWACGESCPHRRTGVLRGCGGPPRPARSTPAFYLVHVHPRLAEPAQRALTRSGTVTT